MTAARSGSEAGGSWIQLMAPYGLGECGRELLLGVGSGLVGGPKAVCGSLPGIVSSSRCSRPLHCVFTR